MAVFPPNGGNRQEKDQPEDGSAKPCHRDTARSWECGMTWIDPNRQGDS
jgi:hypothetical protein